MSGFDAAWLRRREPFDASARSAELARRFASAVSKAGRVTRIVDLAAGTGASFRALAPPVGGDQEWLLVDHDPLLLSQQTNEIARWARVQELHCDVRRNDEAIEIQTVAGCWRARSRTLDLAKDLEEIDLASSDGVTTTAFLDLVSATWLDRLCEALARHRKPFLAAINVDGRRDWQPPLPADSLVTEAFTRHQAGDKGFGPACGPLATSYLQNRLAARGYDVSVAKSDWRLADRDMLLHLIEESNAVARETEPEEAARIAEWAAERRAQLEAGALLIEIGHIDLLAIAAS